MFLLPSSWHRRRQSLLHDCLIKGISVWSQGYYFSVITKGRLSWFSEPLHCNALVKWSIKPRGFAPCSVHFQFDQQYLSLSLYLQSNSKFGFGVFLTMMIVSNDHFNFHWTLFSACRTSEALIKADASNMRVTQEQKFNWKDGSNMRVK